MPGMVNVITVLFLLLRLLATAWAIKRLRVMGDKLLRQKKTQRNVLVTNKIGAGLVVVWCIVSVSLFIFMADIFPSSPFLENWILGVSENIWGRLLKGALCISQALLTILQASLMQTRFSLGLPGQFIGFLVIPKLPHTLDRLDDKRADKAGAGPKPDN